MTNDQGAYLIDATDGELNMRQTVNMPEVPGLVCITHDAQLEYDLRNAFGLEALPQQNRLKVLFQ